MIKYFANQNLKVTLNQLLQTEYRQFFEQHGFEQAINRVERAIEKLAECDPTLAEYPRAYFNLKCQLQLSQTSEDPDKTIFLVSFYLDPKLPGLGNIKTYVSKPNSKRAILFTGDSDNVDAIRAWLGDAFVGTKEYDEEVVAIIIDNGNGEVECYQTEFIVQEGKDFIVYSPDVFLENHDELVLQ